MTWWEDWGFLLVGLAWLTSAGLTHIWSTGQSAGKTHFSQRLRFLQQLAWSCSHGIAEVQQQTSPTMQGSKQKCIHTSQASAGSMFAKIPLAKETWPSPVSEWTRTTKFCRIQESHELGLGKRKLTDLTILSQVCSRRGGEWIVTTLCWARHFPCLRTKPHNNSAR